MKLFIPLASSLLLCSCADMFVSKTYVSTSTTARQTQIDSKDVGSRGAGVRMTSTCGVGAHDPSAIYIRPFCIDEAVFKGGEGSVGEMPIRKALTPIAFAGDLKEQLSKLAPTRILRDNEMPTVGWLVEGEFEVVDGGSAVGRFFLGHFGVGRSALLLHVKVTDVEKHAVVYEFDLDGGSRLQGPAGTVRASGLGRATPFDLQNAAERILLTLSADSSGFGARSSVSL